MAIVVNCPSYQNPKTMPQAILYPFKSKFSQKCLSVIMTKKTLRMCMLLCYALPLVDDCMCTLAHRSVWMKNGTKSRQAKLSRIHKLDFLHAEKIKNLKTNLVTNIIF